MRPFTIVLPLRASINDSPCPGISLPASSVSAHGAAFVRLGVAAGGMEARGLYTDSRS